MMTNDQPVQAEAEGIEAAARQEAGPAGGTPFLPARWRPAPLLACHAIAAAVLASWVWAPTRAAWDALDAAAFHALNGTIAGDGLWTRAMAVANMRAADAAMALVMFALVLRGGWIFPRAQVRRALYAILAILGLLLAIRAAPFAAMVRALDWQRSSPSLTMDGAIRLGERFPRWESIWHIKDSSSRSFPGDHASVALTWAGFLWAYAGEPRRALVAALCALFLLPRLVAGAHWISDVLVGGVALATLALAWGLFTPYAARGADLLERLGRPVVRRLAALPGVRRMSLVADP